MHEAQFHDQSCFLTLTYKDTELPDDFSVSVDVHQKFIRALRDHIAPTRIRFFACGEYGEDDNNPFEGNRPHYHYLIYGYRPSDLKLHSHKNNIKLYLSPTISNIWTKGFITVGDVNYQSAAYCARYVIKKIGGDQATQHYRRVHPVTLQVVQVQPEFAKMSLKPGLGEKWFNTFKSDIYPSDFCIVDGKQHGIPKYYTKRLAEEESQALKRRRKAHQRKHRADNTPARLRVREDVQLEKVKQLKRTLR